MAHAGLTQGEVGLFDGRQVTAAARRLTSGPWRFANAIFILLLVASGLITLIAGSNMSPSAKAWRLIPAASFVAIIFFGGVGVRRLVRHGLERRWRDRGVPKSVLLSVEAAEEGFKIEAETGRSLTPWRFVSEIAPIREHWLLVLPGQVFPVPRYFLEGQAQEQAFVAAVLTRMAPVAVARSTMACAYVGLGAR